MQSWRRFRLLSTADRALVVEAAALICCIRAALPVFSFLFVRRSLHAYARVIHRHVSTRSAIDAARVGWAVSATARHLPGRTSCLVDSLAAEAMLRARGMPCVLRFGVRPPADAPSLDAHAWIECGGVIVAGDVDRLGDYAVLDGQRMR